MIKSKHCPHCGTDQQYTACDCCEAEMPGSRNEDIVIEMYDTGHTSCGGGYGTRKTFHCCSPGCAIALIGVKAGPTAQEGG